jgi:hypothetical protein
VPHSPHGNVVGQQSVQRSLYRRQIMPSSRSDVGNLTPRMHASIGTPSKRPADLLAGKLVPCSFKLALHGAPIVLHLRTDQVRAVVLQLQGNVPQG